MIESAEEHVEKILKEESKITQNKLEEEKGNAEKKSGHDDKDRDGGRSGD